MKKLFLYFVVTTCVLLAVLFILSVQGDKQQQALLQEGKEIVAKIEAYRSKKGKLPESLTALGIEEKMEGPVHYVKRDSVNYYVWFGTTLGESYTYDSNKKKWE